MIIVIIAFSLITNTFLFLFVLGSLFGGISTIIFLAFTIYLLIGIGFGLVKKKINWYFSLLFVSPGLGLFLLCGISGTSQEANHLFWPWTGMGILALLSVEIGIWIGKFFRFLVRRYGV